MRKRMSNHDEVISKIVVELDKDHSTYQSLHRKYHGEEDLEAKHIHNMLTDLCDLIRKNLSLKGNK